MSLKDKKKGNAWKDGTRGPTAEDREQPRSHFKPRGFKPQASEEDACIYTQGGAACGDVEVRGDPCGLRGGDAHETHNRKGKLTFHRGTFARRRSHLPSAYKMATEGKGRSGGGGKREGRGF